MAGLRQQANGHYTIRITVWQTPAASNSAATIRPVVHFMKAFSFEKGKSAFG
jgi:hypothetical protein